MGHLQSDLHDSSQALPQPSTLILNSWKEIASYLGRGVRTIQRYEEKLGLPIHRPAGRERSAVVAFADELERWLRNTPSRSDIPSNLTNGNSSRVIAIAKIQFRNNVRSELERAKQEMERAHAEYRKTVEHYKALKRRIETGEASSPNGKLKRTG
jgi:hypothetical protein